MSYNVFGGTLNLTQLQFRHDGWPGAVCYMGLQFRSTASLQVLFTWLLVGGKTAEDIQVMLISFCRSRLDLSICQTSADF